LYDVVVVLKSRKKAAAKPFNLEACLIAGTRGRKIETYSRGSVIYSQGSRASDVFYIQRGGVKLTVLSATGKEAVVGMLGAGEFFGEGCMAGQALHMGSATALVPAKVYRIPKAEMLRMLHQQEQFSDYFIGHVLARSIRIEEDLVDQLFNSSEKRLARTLLLLARYGQEDDLAGRLPRISQETLADMIGSTRSRVNFFMNKFRKLGLIEYNGTLTVKSSLLSVVLHD
jgi:CRP/FNR family cyclic AMP-dependent transcriptional regulator